jgi:UTP--glucose-1-phosphate uridylyltransferase
MVRIYQRHGCSVVAVENVAREATRRYGIVAVRRGSRSPHRITGIVEKPEPQAAPSTLGVVGRYLLTPRIFHHLRRVKPGSGGEIQLTDAIAALLREQAVLAHEFEGVRFDCGSKLGYLQANVELALRHPEIGAEFRRYLRGRGRSAGK